MTLKGKIWKKIEKLNLRKKFFEQSKEIFGFIHRRRLSRSKKIYSNKIQNFGIAFFQVTVNNLQPF